MSYLHKHREARQHPRNIFPEVRSILMLGICYANIPTPPSRPTIGRVARYAQGPDYHDFLWDKLNTLLAKLQRILPGLQGRGVVDTAPLLERDFARRAGLGWFGKNTMLISKKRGSYLLLAALLLDAKLPSDVPHLQSHCGTCTACLDACPTDALLSPGTLDARKCISYHTIESRDTIPLNLRESIGDWLFGCDICQEVCPWNRKSDSFSLPHNPDLEVLDAQELVGLTQEEFRRRFRLTPLSRPKWEGLRRNALIVLGNTADNKVLPLLTQIFSEESGMLKETAEWAIKEINTRTCNARGASNKETSE